MGKVTDVCFVNTYGVSKWTNVQEAVAKNVREAVRELQDEKKLDVEFVALGNDTLLIVGRER